MRIVHYGSLLLCLGLILPVSAEISDQDRQTYKAMARQVIDEAWNQGKLTVLVDAYKTNMVDTIENNIISWRQGWSDLHIKVTEQLAQGDKVVSLWTFNGTHDGAWHDSAPSYSRVTFSGMTLHQFRNGKIVKEWDSRDEIHFDPQKGMIVGQIKPGLQMRALSLMSEEYREPILSERQFMRFMQDLQRRRFQSTKLDYIDSEVPRHHFTVAQMLEVLDKGRISFSADRRHVFQVFYPRLVDREHVKAALHNPKYFSRTEKRKLEVWINEYQRRRNPY